MKFYDTSRPLYLETDASSFGLGARFLQVRDGMNNERIPDNASLCPIAFTSKSLSNTEQHYNNIEQEALGEVPPLLFC